MDVGSAVVVKPLPPGRGKALSVKPLNLRRLELSALRSGTDKGGKATRNCGRANAPLYICSGCRMRFANLSSLLRCGRCKMVRYFGKECQRLHWLAQHKIECKILRTGQSIASSSSNQAGRADDGDQGDSKLKEMDPISRGIFRRVRCRAFAEVNDWAALERESKLMVDEDDVHIVSIYVGIASAIFHQERATTSSLSLSSPSPSRADEALGWLDRSLLLTNFGDEADEMGIVEAYKLRGDILLKAKRDVLGAIKAYQEVLKRCPEDPEARINLEQLFSLVFCGSC
jgi:hypothetical protein